jgi:hypothetical protein
MVHPRPRGLLIVLAALIVLGVVSLFFSALQYQTSKAASRADVDRNARLTQEVQVGVHQLCVMAADIARQAHLHPADCLKPSNLDFERRP